MQEAEERSPPEVPIQNQPQSTPAANTSTGTVTTMATTTATTAVSAPPSAPMLRNIAEPDRASAMDLDSNANREDRTRATSVLSIDDIEAAQALEGLRTGKPKSDTQNEDAGADNSLPIDFVQSSPSHQSRPSQHHSSTSVTPTSEPRQPEPLLALLTSSHPLLSSARNVSVSAYTSSKSYSPRFKSGAEFIERNIGSPVANTIGTVGRKTGVEGGLRWALQLRERGDTSGGGQRRSKRRKVSEDARGQFDIEKGRLDASMTSRTRRSSDASHAETLPPYDDNTSPNYEDIGRLAISTKEGDDPQTAQSANWQTRLMISTSGLSVAMSEESLRSLTYCLTWLQWANDRLGKSIISLKDVLKEWENAQKQSLDSSGNPEDNPQNRAALLERIQQVKGDVLQTLKQVVDVVSKYAGGALPENARNLVRRHLTSLPQRFRLASTSTPPPESSASTSEMGTSAHRVLVLAQEGLDMMAQVSGVVSDTLLSAEDWCEKLGRKKPEMKQTDGTAGGDEKPKEQGQEEQQSTEPPRALDEKRPLPQDVDMTRFEPKA